MDAMSALKLTPRQMRGLARQVRHLILLPTEKCNFRCVYCSQSFDQGRMRPEVRNAVCRHVEQLPSEVRELKVSWFGGEPLTAFDEVRHISLAIDEHCRRAGIVLDANMTTNGSLLDTEKAEFLLDHRVNTFQISLDGDREAHDQTRLRGGRKPSFDIILGNVQAMAQTNRKFEILLRVHYHADNIRSVERLLDRLAEAFGGDQRVRVFFRYLSPFGAPGDKDIRFIRSTAERELTEKRFRDRLERQGAGGNFWTRPGSAGAPAYVCYAADTNAWVIRADGTLSKCTVELDEPANIVGRLMDDGTFDLDEERLKPWVRPLLHGTPKERACPRGSVLRRRSPGDAGIIARSAAA